MSPQITLRGLLALATVSSVPGWLAAAPEDYVNFIRQVQQDTGLEWDVSVASNGTQVSPTGVSNDGAFFELWAIHNDTVTEYLLDEQYVTAYTPNATINIVSLDPYGPVRRTRVDMPFQVQISVTGLIDINDPNYATAPDASKWVDYSHVTFKYPDGTHSLEEVDDPVGTLFEEGYMEQTADTTITFLAANLSPDSGEDSTELEGEEVFTISAQADFGVSATVLDSDRIQIWPIARGTISGTDSTTEYETIPPISVDLVDLYPDSTTYLRIYQGAPTANPTEFTTVNSSYVIIEDSIPQDRDLVIKDLDDLVNTDGLHTIELLHRTPFGTDLLHTSQINVDRTIVVNGAVTDQEK